MDSFALRRSLKNIKNMLTNLPPPPPKKSSSSPKKSSSSPKKSSSSPKKSSSSPKKSSSSPAKKHYSPRRFKARPPLHPMTYKRRIVHITDGKLVPGIAFNKTRKSKP